MTKIVSQTLLCLAFLGTATLLGASFLDVHAQNANQQQEEEEGQSKQEETPTLTDEQRLQKMAFMNENGIISITYDEPYFYEVPEFSTSFAVLFDKEIITAYGECNDLLKELESDASRRLGPATKTVMNSMRTEDSFAYEKIVSSLLKKYSLKNKVDVETGEDRGTYHPLESNDCTNFDTHNPGIMEQMFLRPTDPRMIGGSVWNESVCAKIDLLKACLEDISRKDIENSSHAKSDGPTADLKTSSRFSQVLNRETN